MYVLVGINLSAIKSLESDLGIGLYQPIFYGNFYAHYLLHVDVMVKQHLSLERTGSTSQK